VWRIRFWRSSGPFVRQTMEWMSKRECVGT
jgi:hypothetical protein